MTTPTLTLVGATAAGGSTGTSFTVVNTGVAVPSGAPLLIGIMGAAFSASSGVVTAVSDNQGNTWTSRHNSGDQDQDGSHHYSLAVYEATAGGAYAAGALTITVTQTAPGVGGAGTVAIAGYVSGTSGEDTAATAFDDTNNSLTGNLVSQATTASTLAGDLAICFGVSYATGGSLTAGTGTTITDSLNGSGGPTVGWMAIGSSATSAGANTYSVNVAGGASFMASWVTGFKPSGGTPTQGLSAQVGTAAKIIAVPQTKLSAMVGTAARILFTPASKLQAQVGTVARIGAIPQITLRAVVGTAASIQTFTNPSWTLKAVVGTVASIQVVPIESINPPTDLWRQEYSTNTPDYSQPPHDVFREITDLPTAQPVTQDSWVIRLRQWGQRFF